MVHHGFGFSWAFSHESKKDKSKQVVSDWKDPSRKGRCIPGYHIVSFWIPTTSWHICWFSQIWDSKIWCNEAKKAHQFAHTRWIYVSTSKKCNEAEFSMHQMKFQRWVTSHQQNCIYLFNQMNTREWVCINSLWVKLLWVLWVF